MKRGPHDLSLPDWGPYSKKTAGISHIADPESGARFDLSVFPGSYRRGVKYPFADREAGYHPWDAAEDGSVFTFRHQLEWKDRLYSDISYFVKDEQTCLVRAECVNTTESDADFTLHALASLHYPPIEPAIPVLPESAFWVDALDYASLEPVHKDPRDSLVFDAFRLGEVRTSGFVNGSALGKRWGETAGDRVTYRFKVETEMANADLLFRYRMPEDTQALIALEGMSTRTLAFTGKGTLVMKVLPVGRLKTGDYELSMVFKEGSPLAFDGIVVLESRHLKGIRFEPENRGTTPKRTGARGENSFLLNYPGLPRQYGLAWEAEFGYVREIITDDIARSLAAHANYCPGRRLDDGGTGHYTDIVVEPVTVNGGERKTVWLTVSTGQPNAVAGVLGAFPGKSATREMEFQSACGRLVAFPANPAGEKYLPSQTRMAATMLTNIVYPIRCRGANIKHSTPGRLWNSLYTWDSGFIGLGLSAFDTDRARENMFAYLTSPEDTDAAFIHHGTPLPVQIYLFAELWNRTRDYKMLVAAYPGLKRMHTFLTGRYGSSSTWNTASNMLSPWNYFYNSGGWDDYPPQKHTHAEKISSRVAPVVTTAHAVRTAKILMEAARLLGLDKDVAEYKRDVSLFTDALQRHSWDEESGYFGYVTHDEAGAPHDILRTPEGINFNMGLDGISPLISGICSESQQMRLIDSLFSPDRMWTDTGISTVDQSAPYYNPAGYWNGAVWMPHQWFIWKALLNCGEADLAAKVAMTALNLWERETGTTYNCYEHFIVRSGRGAGWHQFSGLSCPVVNWFTAYFIPGTLSAGYDVWIEDRQVSPDGKSLTADLTYPSHAPDITAVLVTMAPAAGYRVAYNGDSYPFKPVHEGTLQILLPTDPGKGTLEISAAAD